MHILKTTGALIVLAIYSTVAFGENGYAHHHDAHQHGLGELGIVLEGKELSMVLRAPASDLVGFEHAAETESEREAVLKLERALKSPEKLFGEFLTLRKR